MNKNQQEYAEFIIRELVAEADNGHVRETSAVILARHWVELSVADVAAMVITENAR